MGKLAKEAALAAVQGIADGEVYVFTPDEYNTHLNQFKETEIETALKSRIAKVYGDLDKDFEEVTGKRKPDTEKTYTFWKSVLKEFKDLANSGDVTALKAEIERLKTTGGQGEKVKELEAILTTSKSELETYKGKVTTLEAQIKTQSIMSQIDSGLTGMKFQGLPAPVINTFIDSAKSKLLKVSQVIDGTIVFLDEAGNPRINRETMKPYTPAEILTIELDPIIDKGNNGFKGAGSGKAPEITKDKDGNIDINVIIPPNIRTKTDLTKFLIESGLPFNSKEHNAAYDKYAKTLPVA